MKRFLALILCLTLAFSLLPAAAAEDIEIVDEPEELAEKTPEALPEEEIVIDEPAAVAPGPDAEPQASVVASDKCGANVYWTLYDDGFMQLSGSGSTWNCSGTLNPFEGYSDQIIRVQVLEGVEFIAPYLFCQYNAESLEWIEIGEGVKVYHVAFDYAPSLREIHFKGPAREISEDAFRGVTATAYYPAGDSTWTADVLQNYGGTITWKEDYRVGDNVYWSLDDSGTLEIKGSGDTWDFPREYPGFYSKKDQIKSIVVWPHVTGLGDYLFYGLPELEEIEIGRGVASIGDLCFRYSSKLREIHFLGSAPSFGTDPFLDLTATAYYPGGSTWTSDVLQNYGGTITWVCENIGDNVYWSLDDSGTLTISGEGDTWDFPSDYPGFYGKKDQIKSIVVGPRITGLGDYLFYGLPELEEIEIGKNVASIGDLCFNNCPRLKKILFKWSAPSFGTDPFLGITATATYYPVPGWSSSVLQNYGGTITWVCDNKVGDKATWALDGSGKLRIEGSGDTWGSVMAADKPGFYVFREQIKSVVVGVGITGLGDSLFYGLSWLEKVEIEKDVASLGQVVFSRCVSLTEVRFKGHVPSFSANTFYGVTTTVYYPPVYTWSSDKRQDYGGTLTWVCDDKIGDDATWYLYSGGTLWIEGSGSTWDFPREYPGFYTFQNECEDIYVSGVTGLGEYLFYGISGTGDPIIVDISCVTEIGNLAFAHCGPLDVTLYGSAPRFGTNVFDGTPLVLATYLANDTSWSSAVNSAHGADHVIWAANYTKGAGTVWLKGDSDGYANFAVSSGQAVLVASKLSSGSYRIVPASNSGTKHNYTLKLSTTRAVENLALAFRGDADLNGKVNLRDAKAIKSQIAGDLDPELSAFAKLAADANKDDRLNLRDAQFIKKVVAGDETIEW